MSDLILSPVALASASRPEGVTATRFFTFEVWHELRAQDVTASVAGALLDVHPYETAFNLWMIKSGRDKPAAVQSVAQISDDGMEIVLPPAGRGHAREIETVDLLRQLRPKWSFSHPLDLYYSDPVRRLGATPDIFAVDPERAGFGNIQAKSASYDVAKREWLDPDTREFVPPLWIQAQTLIEAKLTGASWAAIALYREDFGFRPTVRLIPVTMSERVWQWILTEVAAFWQSMADHNPPDPDFRRDGDLLASLYPQDDGSTVDLTGDNRFGEMLADRARLKLVEGAGSSAAKDRKPLDAEIIHKMGNAAAARFGDVVVSTKTTNRSAYSVEPSSFRTIKVKGDVKPAAHGAPVSTPAIPERF